MSAPTRGGGGGREDSQKQTAADRGEGVCQIWMSELKKKDIHFFLVIIIWKYFLSNENSIFEYSVLDKIRLDCKVYPSSIISLLQKQKFLSNF